MRSLYNHSDTHNIMGSIYVLSAIKFNIKGDSWTKSPSSEVVFGYYSNLNPIYALEI